MERNARATFDDDRVRILKQIESQMGLDQANKVVEEALKEGARTFLKIGARNGRKFGYTDAQIDRFVHAARLCGTKEVYLRDGSSNEVKELYLTEVIGGKDYDLTDDWPPMEHPMLH